MHTLVQDLGYAVRSFRRSPSFVLVALLSLTLGIGATSAIFSVIYGVLIAPYPYARPGEIWAPEVRAVDGRGGHTYTLDEFRSLAGVPAFSDVMATSIETVLMTGEFAPESFGGVLLSGNAFNFLGVAPVVGRTIQPADIRPDGEAEPVVVLSSRLWLRLFEGNPSAVGRTLRLNGRPHTIVGVMPPRFGWYGSEGFWLPLSPARRDIPWINPIVRLAPGVSKAVAEEQLIALNKRLALEKPASFPGSGFTTRLRNYLDVTVASGEMQTSLRLLLGAVAFLLLIACANVANLQLARGTARAREMAVRMSIGAGRRRLLRQLLTESVLLSLAGGALGVLFALGAIRSIVALMPEFYVPNESRVAINTPVLLFSMGVSVVTGIVFGLVPALQASKPDLTDALKAGRSTGAGAHGGRTRSLLVVVEVALSVVLLVSAGLTVRTFFVLQNMDAGIKADHVLIVGVPLPQTKYTTLEQRNHFAEELLERVGALPGVEAATFGLPFGGPQSPFTIVGQLSDDSKRIAINLVGADHLRAFGIPLRGGRMFDASEVRGGDRVAVINEAAVTRRHQPIAGGHHHRRDGQHPERRAALRSRPCRRVAVLGDRPGSAHARASHRRGSKPAPESRARPGTGDGCRSASRPSHHTQRHPGPGGHSAAVHDGAVQRVRGAGPRARGGRHLQRPLVPRDAPHAGTGRAHGARRPATTCPRTDVGHGRTAGLPRTPYWSRGERRIHEAAAQSVVRRPAGRSTCLRGCGFGARSRGVRRLLYPRPARGRCRSDGRAPSGVICSGPHRNPVVPPSGGRNSSLLADCLGGTRTVCLSSVRRGTLRVGSTP